MYKRQDVAASSPLFVGDVWAQLHSDRALIVSKSPRVDMEYDPNRCREEEVKGRAFMVLSLLRSKV